MGKQITITLDQLGKFLAQPFHNKFVMLQSSVQPLKDAFNMHIFTTHDDTKQIVDTNELASLIRGKNHKPSEPRPGASYNSEYLDRKLNDMGESRPHIYENHGFVDGTSISFDGIRVLLRTVPILKKGFNYLAFHERSRSVLKLTFLKAWQNIIDNMIDVLIKEARK